jgi:hypothetical protein
MGTGQLILRFTAVEYVLLTSMPRNIPCSIPCLVRPPNTASCAFFAVALAISATGMGQLYLEMDLGGGRRSLTYSDRVPCTRGQWKPYLSFLLELFRQFDEKCRIFDDEDGNSDTSSEGCGTAGGSGEGVHTQKRSSGSVTEFSRYVNYTIGFSDLKNPGNHWTSPQIHRLVWSFGEDRQGKVYSNGNTP